MLTKKMFGILASLLVVAANSYACELCNNVSTNPAIIETTTEEVPPVAPATTLANCPKAKSATSVEQLGQDQQFPVEVELAEADLNQIA